MILSKVSSHTPRPVEGIEPKSKSVGEGVETQLHDWVMFLDHLELDLWSFDCWVLLSRQEA